MSWWITHAETELSEDVLPRRLEQRPRVLR